jgi:hypothetical protein
MGHRSRSGAARALLSVLVSATAAPATGAEAIEVPRIEYLGGVPGQQKGAMGWLRIDPEAIDFVTRAGLVFHLDSRKVEYVAAGPPVAATLVERARHLLSIHYGGGEGETRQLVLFQVHDHSALAVKKLIDERLGLTTEYYREKDRREEEGHRRAEAAATPAGVWTASTNTVVGDVQYFRYLMESGTYSIVIFDSYIGFRPANMDWARYRVPIRRQKRDAAAGNALTPVLEGSRLVGFMHDGMHYEFY